MRTYCTLFDHKYLIKGLALHASLVRHAQPFKLFILALDTETLHILNTMELAHTIVIPLSVIEAQLKLDPVRESRTWMEYCWTLASQFMQFLYWVEKPDLLTYLDADLYFFSSPEPIFDEMNALRAGIEASIAIVPHRFHVGNKRLEANGIFNVGWLTIRDTPEGRACLYRWAGQCRDWCFHRNEDGKFGDQGYLNTWPEDYGEHCCVIENIGAGCAPWNVMCYVASSDHDGNVSLYQPHPNDVGMRSERARQLIFYHFHEFTHDENGNHTRLTRHPHTIDHKRLIYGPYIVAIKVAAQQLVAAYQLRQIEQDKIKEQGERA